MTKSRKPPPQHLKSQALDDLIMGTNSSSITSKRSVERLYYPNEPHFFRYFVPKFMRRSPLVNRGYWIRLKAIDVVVRRFLTSSAGKKKVVINLGAGSDVLPWQCHTRYPEVCVDTIFIDVDYPDLMRKKRAIVLGTPELRELLGNDPFISQEDTDQVLLRSEKYCQLGCDLRQLDTLRQALASFLPLEDCSVLFVAEVSITYMDTLSADAVIQWASSIGHAEFCLLEQILPHGPDQPFAKKMLFHFNKLNTSLKSVHQYPTLQHQTARFHERGWKNVNIWDLWEVWSSDYFLSSAERIALDDVEPFDEWEEFVLFGRHYFVMHAKASGGRTEVPRNPQLPRDFDQKVDISLTSLDVSAPRRRYGGAMFASSAEGQHYAVHALGMGANTRSASCDVYVVNGNDRPLNLSPIGPSARMCHTVTDLGSQGVLLAGGRASPSSAFLDCWMFKTDTNTWQKTFDLPAPLFRHSAVRLPGSSLALVLGGKTSPSQVSPDFFVFHPVKGWMKCEVSGSAPHPVFGAVALNSRNSGTNTKSGVFRGLYSGGMIQDGTICANTFRWELGIATSPPSIRFELVDSANVSPHLSVFGAQSVQVGQATAVCGGVGESSAYSPGQVISLVSLSDDALQTSYSVPSLSAIEKWPLMIGSSVLSQGRNLIVLGGGATCYSFGTFWETGSYLAAIPSSVLRPSAEIEMPAQTMNLQYLESPQMVNPSNEAAVTAQCSKATMTAVPRVSLKSEKDFQEILRNRKPVILQGLTFGECVNKWTPNYMAECLGTTKEVIVHECQTDTEKMDFNSKNFRYTTTTVGSFMERAQRGERLYFRSLSEETAGETPANLDEDFPALAADFELPPELVHVKQQLFSSVLRVSGRVNMWLHYDVMANIYVQVRGSKRMVLFPPTDVSYLAFAPGASSSSLDVFAALETSRLAATEPQEAVLNPGDALLLPSMWFHTATPTTDTSVAVNTFFRDLKGGYSAGRDVYGNRDLAAYEKGRQDVARIGKSFERLPAEIRRFYLARLADELLHGKQG